MKGVGFKCPKCGCEEYDERRHWDGTLRVSQPGKVIGRKCRNCNAFVPESSADSESDVGGSVGIRSEKEG